MTGSGDTVEKYVLIFDFCSSTSIMDDLILSERQERWPKLLTDIKNFLEEESVAHGFEVYKFIGDGWILLFNNDFPPKELFSFLNRLCNKYNDIYKRYIRPILSTTINNVGITFGLEKGGLIPIGMCKQSEYIGRPLNIAARLQNAIKDKDSRPQGKVLMSKKVYDEVRRGGISRNYKVYSVTRKLRNISGGERYPAIKLILCENP